MNPSADDFSFFVEMPEDREIKIAQRPFVKLWIYDTASRDDLLKFVRKNWNFIKYNIAHQSIKPVGRIKSTDHKDRDRMILELYELPKKDLHQMAGVSDKKTYRETLVGIILSSRGEKNITSDAVKKVIVRYRKKFRDM